MNYPVVIHKDKKSDYGVTVPDLPGCFSGGETLEDALENSKEAILCHIEGLLADKEPIPSAKTIEEHQKSNDYGKSIWALVTVDLGDVKGKSVRINITVPERFLSQVDSFSRKNGETRSGFLVHAAMEYISTHKK